MNSISHHPIRVCDVKQLQSMLGICGTEFCWLVGATPCRWSSLQRDWRLTPERLASPPLALLVRWMAKHPADSPSLFAPDPSKFLRKLRGAIGDITAKSFALSLGWDATAGSRWVRRTSPIRPTGRRALGLLDDQNPERVAAKWAEWTENAFQEARLRGIDLNSSLRWRTTAAREEATA
ncbi:MAG TPA: hypothetical protein HPQ04_02225 [Rhodospirillaceae bacterium]|nr:hypothetical protein [Rhodospirillaceae bacterium]